MWVAVNPLFIAEGGTRLPAGQLQGGKPFNLSLKPLWGLTDNCGDGEIASRGAGWRINKLHTGSSLQREGGEHESEGFQGQQSPCVRCTAEHEQHNHLPHHPKIGTSVGRQHPDGGGVGPVC